MITVQQARENSKNSFEIKKKEQEERDKIINQELLNRISEGIETVSKEGIYTYPVYDVPMSKVTIEEIKSKGFDIIQLNSYAYVVSWDSDVNNVINHLKKSWKEAKCI